METTKEHVVEDLAIEPELIRWIRIQMIPAEFHVRFTEIPWGQFSKRENLQGVQYNFIFETVGFLKKTRFQIYLLQNPSS